MTVCLSCTILLKKRTEVDGPEDGKSERPEERYPYDLMQTKDL